MTNLITAPFAWIMRLFFELTGSYGVALILFSLVVKLVLLPFQLKSKKSMVRMGRLSGKQKELERQYANNKMKYQEELQKLYTEEGVNPMGGCLWSFLPIFIIWPLYYIVRQPMTYFMRLGEETVTAIRELAQTLGYNPTMTNGNLGVYEQIDLAQFVSNNWASFDGKFDGLMNVNFNFLKLDLTAMPWNMVKNFEVHWECIGVILIPIISGLLSYLLSKVTSTSNGQEMQPAMKSMMITMPLMSVWICFIMPAAMGDGFMDEIRGFLEARVSDALDAGIRRESIILDPGIGFGKDPAQNSEILENSSYFSCGGYPVLSASSRKRFLATRYPGMDRDDASAEAALVAVRSGAAMVRVHNVARTAELLGLRRGLKDTSRRWRRPSR